MDKILHNKYIVGAYATSPNIFNWDENSEVKYFDKLKKIKELRGLELPFWGHGLHPFDDNFLLKNLDPKWENIFTCVPGTVNFIEKDEFFGLSSKKEKSRIKAIKFYKKAFDSINKIKSTFGEKSIFSILITSSPQKHKNNTSVDSFVKSLMEIHSWDWGDTKINIEHCDAFGKLNPNPKKGYLALEDEILSLKKVNNYIKSNIGIVINWGRSAIEYKGVNGPLKHIRKALKSKVLSGLMFSGTSKLNSVYYGSWSDLHMPPSPYKNFKFFEKNSLMSHNNIKNSIILCKDTSLDFFGIKLHSDPKNLSIDKSILINQNTLSLLKDISLNINNNK